MAKKSVSAKKPYQVFLSHSSQDTWICQRMREKMEEQGIAVWLDVFDLPGGGPILELVIEGILASEETLILLSPSSRESDWVKHEAGIANGHGKWITFLLLHASESDVPKPLRDQKALSINEFDSYLAQLIVRAKAFPGGKP
jgi:hypothetical protein